MFKCLASFFLLLTVLLGTSASLQAKTHVKKAKKKSSKSYKVSKHKRKSRHYNHHGNGPDLKSITTDSTYKEDTNNGVNPIETKQPEQLEVKK